MWIRIITFIKEKDINGDDTIRNMINGLLVKNSEQFCPF